MGRSIAILAVLAGTLLALPGAAPAQDNAAACTALSGAEVPTSAIGLPTSGAKVTAASLDPAGYCKVLGAIAPKDPKAPNINFQLNLPNSWNRKVVHFGGGGFDGSIPVTTGPARFGDPKGPTVVSLGYATFASDSGHQAVRGQDAAAFAANDEAMHNFAGDQLKKTHDVAIALIKQRYGAAPKRMYFNGNSQGGHEALVALKRWPKDYDGAIAVHPVYDLTVLHLDANHLAQALYRGPGSWVSPAKALMIYNKVIATCDELDGVKDGLISNVRGCNKVYTPQSLSCPGLPGPDCLTQAEVETIAVWNSPWKIGFPVEGGIDSFPKWPLLEGGDIRTNLGFGSSPNLQRPPVGGQNAFQATMGDQQVRWFITRDPTFDSIKFDPKDWKKQIVEVSNMQDASTSDLGAFRRHGGKLLLMHGTIDMSVTPHNTIMYWDRLVKRYGLADTKSFARFYLAPGFSHGGGTFAVAWDSLTALDEWVEKGKAPGPQVASDTNTETLGRTRPLCEYPAWPKYKGTGDINSAASFTCAVR